MLDIDTIKTLANYGAPAVLLALVIGFVLVRLNGKTDKILEASAGGVAAVNELRTDLRENTSDLRANTAALAHLATRLDNMLDKRT